MQKRNRFPIDIGRKQKYKVDDIGVPNNWWDVAWYLFFCRILSDDLHPVDVDKLSEEGYNEAHEILSMAIKEFDISNAAIHTVSIRMFRALFSRTDKQACRSPMCCMSALHRTGLWNCAQLICQSVWDPFEWWPPKANNKANLCVPILVSSFRLWEWSMTEHHWFD